MYMSTRIEKAFPEVFPRIALECQSLFQHAQSESVIDYSLPICRPFHLADNHRPHRHHLIPENENSQKLYIYLTQ